MIIFGREKYYIYKINYISDQDVSQNKIYLLHKHMYVHILKLLRALKYNYIYFSQHFRILARYRIN